MAVGEDQTPITIDGMLSTAATAGHPVTKRLIRDWSSLGLLDHPLRQPAGKGHGSRPALYPWSQARLLEVLLHHRAQGQRIQGLARTPVAM